LLGLLARRRSGLLGLANGFLRWCNLANLARFLNRSLGLLDYLLGRRP
jgi:hypothetical protein